MEVKIIGIAGGSGCGKSTLAVSLCKKYPAKFALLHVDDYFKSREFFEKRENVPMIGDLLNLDHPDALRMDDLYNDILSLSNGKPVTLMTKSELYNPAFTVALRNKIEYTIEPKPILIVEGFLALYDEQIRNLMDLKIYLDISVEESIKRRSANKIAPNAEYIEKVLIPMHREFVEPTKEFADVIIDVSDKSADEVFALVEDKILHE